MRRGSIAAALCAIGLASTGASADGDGAAEVRPWLGITFADLHSPTYPYAIESGGIRVDDVYPRTAAARAGVLAGDEIVAIDGDFVGSGNYLRALVTRHGVGDRLRVTVVRDGRQLVLSARLTAMPPAGELLEQRLLGAPLPPMELDHRGDGGPALLVVFDARCEACSGPASALVERARDAGLELSLRTVIIGTRDETTSYLARNPVAGAVARWEATADLPRASSVMSGLQIFSEGAILVVDGSGVVQFAASTADLDVVAAGALAAAARVQERWARGGDRRPASAPAAPPLRYSSR